MIAWVLFGGILGAVSLAVWLALWIGVSLFGVTPPEACKGCGADWSL